MEKLLPEEGPLEELLKGSLPPEEDQPLEELLKGSLPLEGNLQESLPPEGKQPEGKQPLEGPQEESRILLQGLQSLQGLFKTF